MSLLNLKPRPIPSRDKDPGTLLDGRLFIIACDDRYAPPQYFTFFKLSSVTFLSIPTEDGTSHARHVLKRLLDYKTEKDSKYEDGDELWMVLDTDHLIRGSHRKGFEDALQDAQDNGVKIALSRPCFELWLLMHHVSGTELIDLPNAKAVCKELSTQLGGYNKNKLKKEHFPLSSVALAYERAERLDQSVTGGTIPNANTSRVYLIWKAVAEKAHPSQIPVELHGLLPQMRQGAPNQN
jgi:hypothetical protein